jgi:wobble nucleotide-excising tRNase
LRAAAVLAVKSRSWGIVVVESIQLVRNVGPFDSVSAGMNLTLLKLALLYAENGRGKTTLAAILRSLASSSFPARRSDTGTRCCASPL